MSCELRLYKSLSDKKEKFKPLNSGKVGMYCCGPTVYWYQHLGNMRIYVLEDVLKRIFLYLGYKVDHIVNITDVGHLTSDADTGEDKLEKAAKRERKTVWEIADFYTSAFMEDIKALNILMPSLWAKATDHIKDQIKWIRRIEKAGYAYLIEGEGLFFDTNKYKPYGKLIPPKQLEKAKPRVIGIKGKRNYRDFALWKLSRPDENRQMEWDSPWGVGYPGWHIECSVMSTKYLGEQFDVHCGGIEHRFIHHPNEIAQTECVTGKVPWVSYWWHGQWLQLGGRKVAKSSGDAIRVRSLAEHGLDPMDYRYFLLGTHYRKPQEFSWDLVKSARFARMRLLQNLRRYPSGGSVYGKYKGLFLDAICDDMNIPASLAVIWDLLGDSKVEDADKLATILDFDSVLGLNLRESWSIRPPAEVLKLLSKRNSARNEKDWDAADELRKKIEKLGWIVEDTQDGSIVVK